MKVASRKDATARSLAQRRADFTAQAERYLAEREAMAVADLSQVRKRLKGLRKELEQQAGEKVQQYTVANLIDVPPRTFQSWENGEVETEGRNYDLVARFYSKKLGREVTRNWILWGQEEPPDAETLSQAEPASPGTVEAMLRELLDQQAQLLSDVSQVRSEQERLSPLIERLSRAPAAKRRGSSS